MVFSCYYTCRLNILDAKHPLERGILLGRLCPDILDRRPGDTPRIPSGADPTWAPNTSVRNALSIVETRPTSSDRIPRTLPPRLNARALLYHSQMGYPLAEAISGLVTQGIDAASKSRLTVTKQTLQGGSSARIMSCMIACVSISAPSNSSHTRPRTQTPPYMFTAWHVIPTSHPAPGVDEGLGCFSFPESINLAWYFALQVSVSPGCMTTNS